MIRITSPKTQYRAATALLAAAALSIVAAHHASAQTIDLFAIDPTTPGGTPAILSASATLTLGGAVGPTVFGTPGYTGTVNVAAGAANTVSEQFTPNGASNQLIITESGVLGLLSATTATKTFTAAILPNTRYSFTLTRTAGFTVGLLNSFNVALTAGGSNVFQNSGNTGLLGVVDVVSLFGGGNTATFQFVTPASLPTTNLQVSFTGNLPAGVGTGSYTFGSASITQVPEPRTVAVMMIGMTGLVLLRLRRRNSRHSWNA